jgi:hypothetical protein
MIRRCASIPGGDLGIADATSIWFTQDAGLEIYVIDYYEAEGEGLPHYAHVLDRKGYLYGRSSRRTD